MNILNISIDTYAKYNEQEIIHLYNSVGWTAYTASPENLRLGFENSLLVLGAFSDSGLLGVIRVVGDGYTIVLIQDILVLPGYQRQGIGSRLIKAVLEHFASVRQIQLFTDNTAKTKAFYNALGFQEASILNCCGFMKQ